MRKIIGQCNTSDFATLAHLSGLMERGEEVDLTNLTNRQKVAVRVLEHFMKKHIPLKVLSKLREVLLWDLGDGSAGFEYKLIDPRDDETQAILRGYR